MLDRHDHIVMISLWKLYIKLSHTNNQFLFNVIENMPAFASPLKKSGRYVKIHRNIKKNYDIYMHAVLNHIYLKLTIATFIINILWEKIRSFNRYYYLFENWYRRCETKSNCTIKLSLFMLPLIYLICLIFISRYSGKIYSPHNDI